MLNAHISYKLKNLIQTGDYLYHVGDWIEDAATQMKTKVLAATRTVKTQAASAAPAGNAEIANKKAYGLPGIGALAGHFAVSYRADDQNAARWLCKTPSCNRQMQSYGRKCEVHLSIADIDGTSCFEIFHTRQTLGPGP